MKRPSVTKSIAVAVLLAGLLGCHRHEENALTTAPNLPRVQVQVRAAEIKSQPVCEEVLGSVHAKVRATLEAKVSGRIESIPVLLGQKVKAGELLATLDAAEIRARVEQAEANMQLAQREWDRISALFSQQAVTRSERDAADSRLLVAKASVTEARAILADAEVRSPFNGVVTKKWVDTGDLAAPGKPLIDIEDPSALEVDADVPEAVISKVRREEQLEIHSDSVSGKLVGSVSEIAPAADPGSRTFRVKLTLPSSGGLMSGQFVRMLLPVGKGQSVRVPASAVVIRGQLEMVFVVTNQAAQLHLVKTGKRFDTEMEILAGLEPGENIVVEGAGLLADGQPVEVK